MTRRKGVAAVPRAGAVSVLGSLCILGLLEGCSRSEPVEPPPLGEVEVVLSGFDSLRVQLEDGAGEVTSRDGVLIARASLTEWRVVGDLDRDGRLDALVVARSTGGGSGTFVDLMHLVLVDAGDASSAWGWAGAVPLGDRVRVRALTEADGRVELHLTEHGPDDPLCCPSVDTVRTFDLRDGVLAPAALP